MTSRRSGWLFGLLALYAAARLAQLFADAIPTVVLVSLHVLPALGFALLHGAMVYRLRGILIFVVLCIAIGNFFENLSILTGFPFGHYHFTDAMGPKVLAVPVLLGLAYVGMGYISWTVARVILGDKPGDAGQRLSGSRLWTRPVVAAFVMVAWDFSQDHVWSNLVHAWRWHDGGAYFGVPLTNFGGWYLTVFAIYLAFALTVCRNPAGHPPRDRKFWLTAVLFYGASAFGNLLVPQPAAATVMDAAGMQWPVAGIMGTSALVSVLLMGAFAVLAAVRLLDAAD